MSHFFTTLLNYCPSYASPSKQEHLDTRNYSSYLFSGLSPLPSTPPMSSPPNTRWCDDPSLPRSFIQHLLLLAWCYCSFFRPCPLHHKTFGEKVYLHSSSFLVPKTLVQNHTNVGRMKAEPGQDKTLVTPDILQENYLNISSQYG